MYKNKQIYFGIIILILWHIFMLFCYNSPKVSDMYYQYYIKGGIEKWNRGIGSRYSYGDRIDFRKGGNSSDYILCGFSDQEKMGTWTCSENVYLFLLLNSTTKHKDKVYEGEHQDIVDKEIFEQVRKLLIENRIPDKVTKEKYSSLLAGKIFDDKDNYMSPSHSNSRNRRYRYYVSQAIIQSRKHEAGSISKIPANEIERVVADEIKAFFLKHSNC